MIEPKLRSAHDRMRQAANRRAAIRYAQEHVALRDGLPPLVFEAVTYDVNARGGLDIELFVDADRAEREHGDRVILTGLRNEREEIGR